MASSDTLAWPRAWLPYARAQEVAPVRLFCFPHSGGGASAFRTWRGVLAPTAQVCGVQLPGRENRRAETCHQGMGALLDALVPALAPLLAEPGRPYALFGHSMGADVAFALTRRLREEGLPAPVRLFVAAHLPPHLPELEPDAHPLSDREFIARVRRYGGTDDSVWDNQELVDLLLPTLRSDFRLFETFRVGADDRVDCPISVLGGAADPAVQPEALRQWRQLTAGDCSIRLFEGAHFFVERALPDVAKAITADLTRDLKGR